MIKNSPAKAGTTRDAGWIPGLRRSPGGGNGSPLQYNTGIISWTEKPGGLQFMISQSQTWLSN